MSTIKDAFGTEVQVGDSVIFSETTSYRNLTKGIVAKVCPKSIIAEYTFVYRGVEHKRTSILPQAKFMKQPSEYAKPAYSIT